jgi:tRNA threonylcarbamoyladenosine modification (KEOPS) complex  Pcc1 subunit
LESYKAKIHIYFRFNQSINSDLLQYHRKRIEKQLNSAYIAIKGDIQSTPEFDTKVTTFIEGNRIVLNITGNNISKFRATVLSFLRLVDLSFSVIQIDNQND